MRPRQCSPPALSLPISVARIIGTAIYHLEPATLGLLFGAAALGYLVGNGIAGRYAARRGPLAKRGESHGAVDFAIVCPQVDGPAVLDRNRWTIRHFGLLHSPSHSGTTGPHEAPS